METLALIIFLLPIVGGGIYFLALLVQGEISLPSIPPSLLANQSSDNTQRSMVDEQFEYAYHFDNPLWLLHHSSREDDD